MTQVNNDVFDGTWYLGPVTKLACEKLGARLYDVRNRAGLTMSGLADRSSVAASTINAIEKGRQIPAADTIERLARALGIRACWLAYGEEPEHVLGKSGL